MANCRTVDSRRTVLMALLAVWLHLPSASSQVYPVTVPGSAIEGNEVATVDLEPGDFVQIVSISGLVNFNISGLCSSAMYTVSASGLARSIYDDPANVASCFAADHSCSDPLMTSPHAGLTYTIDGETGFVGAQTSFVASTFATLFLGINDCALTQNSGAFSIEVRITTPEVFSDGFESGNTTMWSATVP